MLNPGVVVKLKSGGPSMTVVQSDADKNIVCTWFDLNHGVQTGTFKLAMLRREAVAANVKPLSKAA